MLCIIFRNKRDGVEDRQRGEGGSSVVEHVLSMHKALPVSSSWLPSEKGSSLSRLYRHRLCENRYKNLVDGVGQYLSSVLGGS